MQTLTAGSFLNLENDSTIEALKHTARRLAEHTATVVKENLTRAALENLARQLWEKAEYVTRETERLRLHQIFVENFNERFRELKPEIAEPQNSDSVFTSSEDSAVENHKSAEQPLAPAAARSGEIKSPASVETPASPVSSEAYATEAYGKKDEFLGFVGPGEPFDDEREAQAFTTVPEISQPETRAALIGTPNSANQVAGADDSKEPGTAENSNHAKMETTKNSASAAENKPTAAAAATTVATASASKSGTGAREEPFEFEKCTINLSLTLLPAESGSGKRKAIVGAASHNLPPEIDFLEIGDGADLTQIAALVNDKLARFKQTLPVKYIEQLRQSKNKPAKKSAPAKTTASAATAAPTQPAVNQPKAEKTSGEQKMSEAVKAETAKPQTESATDKGDVTISHATVPSVNQSSAANNIQGSLF